MPYNRHSYTIVSAGRGRVANLTLGNSHKKTVGTEVYDLKFVISFTRLLINFLSSLLVASFSTPLDFFIPLLLFIVHIPIDSML